MEYLYFIGIPFTYLIGVGFTYGYLKPTHKREYADLFEGPVPQALVWPITLSYLLVGSYFQRLGESLATRQLAQRKQRVELQEKFRIELEQAERELEEQLMEEEEDDSEGTKESTSGA